MVLSALANLRFSPENARRWAELLADATSQLRVAPVRAAGTRSRGRAPTMSMTPARRRVPVTRSQRLDERGAVRGAQSDHRVVAGWGYLEGSTIRAGVRLGGPGRPFWVSLAGRSGRAVLVLGPRGSLELDRGTHRGKDVQGAGSAGDVAAVDGSRDADEKAGAWAAQPEETVAVISAPRTTSDRLVGDCVFDGQFVFGDHVGDHWGFDRSGQTALMGSRVARVPARRFWVRPRTACLVVW